MFQFRRFPSYTYLIQYMMTEYCSAGFPHSEIHGSMAAFASPWLFADCCVLRRLLVPRHSPCALCSLTIVSNLVLSTRRKLLVFITLIIYHVFFALLFDIFSLFSFQGAFFNKVSLVGGLKWTRTTDLTLIRRAL